MSYIHCYHDNYYRPSESLQTLFEKLVLQPFENHLSTPAWEYHVKDTDYTYHREVILQQGSANFNKEFEGLPPEDMVLLYCCYYMPMHLFSSYHIFTRYFTPVTDKAIFIDFGCGPLTSGIAFWAAFAKSLDITCICIDKSKAMLNKAQEINGYGYGGIRFFTEGWLTSNCNRLHEDLDKCIANADQTQIIFNFCYSLARDTLDTESLSIENLSNALIQTIKKYNQHKMFVIYQNPPIPQGFDLQSSYLHENWYFLKTQLSAFRSQITGSNTDQFRYDSLIDSSLVPCKFYFDILSNKSFDYSNDPCQRGTPWNS